jgi:DNA-binding XRE family transcriptional regulator
VPKRSSRSTKKPDRPKRDIPNHGPSEFLERPSVVRALKREQRRLGLRLRVLRVQRHLTQLEAAELVGIHPTHVSRVESGSTESKLGTLVAFAKAYGVTMAELFEETDYPTDVVDAAHKRVWHGRD